MDGVLPVDFIANAYLFRIGELLYKRPGGWLVGPDQADRIGGWGVVCIFMWTFDTTADRK